MSAEGPRERHTRGNGRPGERSGRSPRPERPDGDRPRFPRDGDGERRGPRREDRDGERRGPRREDRDGDRSRFRNDGDRDRPRVRNDGEGDRERRPRSDDRGRSLGPRLTPKAPRRPEPAILEGITGKELDRGIHNQLRTLSKENAEGVAQHLVMVGMRLEEDDIPAALAHAETAVRRAGRVPAAREALGMVAYRMGDWAKALSEFRTVRRLSGSPHLLPLMVDCERALGRLDRALELATDPDSRSLTNAEKVELAIVISGVRRDLGQRDAAPLGLQPLLAGPVRPWSARLYYAYADALLDKGEAGAAREWFAKALAADTDFTTDAGDRVDELDGVVFIDVDDDSDDDGQDDSPTSGAGEPV
jgi:hypothetical protein